MEGSHSSELKTPDEETQADRLVDIDTELNKERLEYRVRVTLTSLIISLTISLFWAIMFRLFYQLDGEKNRPACARVIKFFTKSGYAYVMVQAFELYWASIPYLYARYEGTVPLHFIRTSARFCLVQFLFLGTCIAYFLGSPPHVPSTPEYA